MCGKTIKIIGFVTHPVEINRILKKVGRSIDLQEFDPAYLVFNGEFCQLIQGSIDGFPSLEEEQRSWIEPNSPFPESHSDPPHQENEYISSHWVNEIDPLHLDGGEIDPPHPED